jgi:NAD-dependent deacetylase
MNDTIREAAEIIRDSKNLIALTGAGISVESGIPDFRSPGGLWEKFDPEIYASIDTFNRLPGKAWEMIFEMMNVIIDAKPNPAHMSLAWMEEKGYLKSVVTQNVDNLHQAAGSKNVIEYHGNSSMLQCVHCHTDNEADRFREKLKKKEIPRCAECDRILKPSVVFFGEMIPQRALIESQFMAESADGVLVVGTSALIYPAAGIPVTAKNSGAKVIEFNLEETNYTESITDIFIGGPAGETLPAVVDALRELTGAGH